MKEGDFELTNQEGGDDTHDKVTGSSDPFRSLSRLGSSFAFSLPLS